MKKPIILFSILISFSAYGGWFSSDSGLKKVSNSLGNAYYIDTDTIKEYSGYVYYWYLEDFIKPEYRSMSSKSYIQADCNRFQYKTLSVIFYKQPMGIEQGSSADGSNMWGPVFDDTVGGDLFNYACDYVK